MKQRLSRYIGLVLLALSVRAQPVLITPQNQNFAGSSISNLRLLRQTPDGVDAILTVDFNYDGIHGPTARLLPVITDKKQVGISSWFGANPVTISAGHGTVSLRVKFFNDEPGVPAELTTDHVRVMMLADGGNSVLSQGIFSRTIKWGSPNVVPAPAQLPRMDEERARAEKDRHDSEERAKAGALAKARDEARLKAELEEKSRAKAAAKQLAEEKAKAEAEARTREEARLKAEAQEKARQEAVARELAEEKAKAEAAAKAREEARIKAETEEKQRQVAEAKRLADEKAKAEAEAKTEAEAKAREEARLKAEADEKARQAVVAKQLAEEKAKAEAEARARENARLKAEAEEKVRQEAVARQLAEEKAKAQAEAAAREQARLKAEAEEKAREIAAAKQLAEEKARAEAEAHAREEVAKHVAKETVAGATTQTAPVTKAPFALSSKQKTKVTNVDVVNRNIDRTEMTIAVEYQYSKGDGPVRMGVDLASTEDTAVSDYFSCAPLDVGNSSRNFVMFPVKLNLSAAQSANRPTLPTDKVWVYLADSSGQKSYIYQGTMMLVWHTGGARQQDTLTPTTAAGGNTLEIESFKQNDLFSGYITVNYNMHASKGRLHLRVFDSANPSTASWFYSEDVQIKSGPGLELVKIAVPKNAASPDVFNADTVEIQMLDGKGTVLTSLRKKEPMSWAKPK